MSKENTLTQVGLTAKKIKKASKRAQLDQENVGAKR